MKLTTHKAQAAIEYMLIFAVICIVVLLALAPNGFMTKAIEQSINVSIDGLESMADNVYYDVDNE